VSRARIDLHTHSNASDGTDTPAELIAAARAAQLDVLALTDHDTTAGWDEAARALPDGMRLLPGVEISAYVVESGRHISLHLLGYLVDPLHPALAQALARLRESRAARARRMVDALVAAGMPVTWEQVASIARGGVIGRPHVARALVEAGLVPSVDAAFSPEWLATGGRFYVDKAELPVLEAVRLVREAGGASVFAHPEASRRGVVVGDDTYLAMAEAGLGGLEADHPDHDAAQRERVRAKARELGLFVTGSSDYHGLSKTVRLGEELTTPEAYEALIAQASNPPLGPA
jgi:predicted metal-dependent phosphoesterase TrpH